MSKLNGIAEHANGATPTHKNIKSLMINVKSTQNGSSGYSRYGLKSPDSSKTSHSGRATHPSCYRDYNTASSVQLKNEVSVANSKRCRNTVTPIKTSSKISDNNKTALTVDRHKHGKSEQMNMHLSFTHKSNSYRNPQVFGIPDYSDTEVFSEQSPIIKFGVKKNLDSTLYNC